MKMLREIVQRAANVDRESAIEMRGMETEYGTIGPELNRAWKTLLKKLKEVRP